MQIIQEWVNRTPNATLSNTYFDKINGKKSKALKQIKKAVKCAKRLQSTTIVLCYSGHSHLGNWIFVDNEVTLNDIMNLKPLDITFKIYNNCYFSYLWCLTARDIFETGFV